MPMTNQQKRDLIAELNEDIGVEYAEARAEERKPAGIVHLLGRVRDALEESLAPQPQAVRDERKRAIEKGYDAEHDDAHGREHLIRWAKRYALDGEAAKAAGMLVALSEYDDRNAAPQPTDDERAPAAAALRIRDDMLVSHVQGLNRIARSAAADPSRHPSTPRVVEYEESVGWYEFIMPGGATTHIGYAYEDGSVYLPEGPSVVTEGDFRLASATDSFWKLERPSPPVAEKGESNG